MSRKKFLGAIITVFAVCVLCSKGFALPDDFYHNFYKVESKGFSGKVLKKQSQLPTPLVFPSIPSDHVAFSTYSESDACKWIITPVYPGSNEFFIINKETGYPLMIDDDYVISNTTGEASNYQRFHFKNTIGDYSQISCTQIGGCFYYKHHDLTNSYGSDLGDYYSLSYSTDQSLNNDYSYFKLLAVEDIPGSENVSPANLIHQPDLVFCISSPPMEIPDLESFVPDTANTTIIGESWIPCCLVNDDYYSPRNRAIYSPYYKLIRTQVWEKVIDYFYGPGYPDSVTYGVNRGIKAQDAEITQSIINTSWTVRGGVVFTFNGVYASLGTSFREQLCTESYNVEKYPTDQCDQDTVRIKFLTAQKRRIVEYQITDRYYLQRMDGSLVDDWKIYYSHMTRCRFWLEIPLGVAIDPDSKMVETTEGDAPSGIYPNPFNGSTTISFHVKEYQHVNITVYDILGKRVRTLLNSHQDIGSHKVIWDGRNQYGNAASSGLYFVRIQTPDNAQVFKVSYLK